MTVTTSSIITLIRGLIKDLLNTTGRNTFEYDGDASFKLSTYNVSSSTINVYQNGTLLSTDDWSYNSNTNKVTITPVTSGVSLTSGDSIIITFSFYEKYSDTELVGYIKSNLVQFTKHRYKKSFYMDTDNEIYTLNGENPTNDEGNMIALITAIDIDPQNIKVQIVGDFNLSSAETMSKTEQINEVFSQFTKCYGLLEFIQDNFNE
jgi:hypothetical protein